MSHDSSSTKQSKLPLYLSLGLVACFVLAYFYIPSVQTFLNEAWQVFTSGDEKQAELWVEQFGFWGPLVIVLVMILQMFLIVIPTPLLMIVTIMAYGPIWGSLILFVAVFSASSVGYFVGGYFGSNLVIRLIGEKTNQKVQQFIDRYGFWTVVIVKLAPFLSNDAIGFVAGSLRMGYWRFIAASLFGSLPLIGFIAYLKQNYALMAEGLLWGSVGSILLFVAFVWWDRKRN